MHQLPQNPAPDTSNGSVTRFAEFELDESTRELRRGGEPIELEPKAFDLLAYLLAHRDRVVSRQELLDALWGNESVYESSLTSCLSRLRNALGDRGRLIRTHYGKGYRFSGIGAVGEPGIRAVDFRPCGRPAFVGRNEDLAVLREAFDETSRGRGGLVLVSGAQGIGKTRLVEEFGRSVRSSACVLHGRCPEGTGAPPFWPWSQLLRGYVERHGADVVRSEVGPDAQDLAPLAPELCAAIGAPPPAGNGVNGHARPADAVRTFLSWSSRREPMLLVIDDLHWADRASLGLLQDVASSLGEMAVLVVATHREPRTADESSLDDALPDLREAPGYRSLGLGGLAPESVAELIDSIAGRKALPILVERVLEESNGNPFLVEQIALRLAERSEWATAESDAPLESAVPAGTELVHGQRFLRLSLGCRRLLGVAAVAGPRFDLRLVESVLAEDRGSSYEPFQIRVELAEAVSAGLLRPSPSSGDEYVFAHMLVRESVLRNLRPSELADLHGRIGEAMHGSSQTRFAVSEVADHFVRGAAVAGPAKAVEHATRAGEAAEASFSYDQAVRWYDEALSILSLAPEIGGAERLGILIRLARAQWNAGMLQASEETAGLAIHLARRSKDPLGVAHAALARGLSAAQGTVDAEYARTLEEAAAALGPGDDALRARVLARLAWAHYYSRDRGVKRSAIGRRAIALARRIGEPATLLWTLCEVHAAFTDPDHSEERLHLANEVVELARGHGQREFLALGLAFRAWDLAERGALPEADRDMAECGAIADEINHPLCRWRHALWQSMRAVFSGRFEEAEQLGRSSFAIGSNLDPEMALFTVANQSLTLQGLRGQLDGLDMELQALLSDYPLLQLPRGALAYVLAQQGQIDEAVQVAEQVLASGVDRLFWDSTVLTTLGFVGLVYAEAGDATRAAEVYRLLLPYENLSAVLGVHASVWYGPVAWPLGALAASLGRWSESEAHFGVALDICRRNQARPWLAQLCVENARVLLRRGRETDRARATALLAEADDLARDLGLAVLRALIARLA